MSRHFLHTLLRKSTGELPVVRPRQISLFEPDPYLRHLNNEFSNFSDPLFFDDDNAQSFKDSPDPVATAPSSPPPQAPNSSRITKEIADPHVPPEKKTAREPLSPPSPSVQEERFAPSLSSQQHSIHPSDPHRKQGETPPEKTEKQRTMPGSPQKRVIPDLERQPSVHSSEPELQQRSSPKPSPLRQTLPSEDISHYEHVRKSLTPEKPVKKTDTGTNSPVRQIDPKETLRHHPKPPRVSSQNIRTPVLLRPSSVSPSPEATTQKDVQPPQVTISIGTIEIRTTEKKQPARNMGQTPAREPALSLDDYLRQVNGDKK